MKVFIIHYTKLKERRQHIENQLSKYNFDVEFITDHDKENLTDSDLALFDTGILTSSEMSLIRKHISCYEQICKQDLDYALIFEDDVTLISDFQKTLENYMEQLPRIWDLFFIGEGGSHKFHIPDHIINKHPLGTNVFHKSNYSSSWGGSGASRCADSYLVSNKAAYKMLKYIDQPEYKIMKEADHLLNEIALFNIFKVYWAEPTIVKQESNGGKFTSSLDNGSVSRMNIAKAEMTKQTFDHIKEQKLSNSVKQRKNNQQMENAANGIHQTAKATSKPIRNTDRPLSSLRSVAGRRLAAPNNGSSKGRFSKFSF